MSKASEYYVDAAQSLRVAEAAIREAFDAGYHRGYEIGRRETLDAVREKLDGTNPQPPVKLRTPGQPEFMR